MYLYRAFPMTYFRLLPGLLSSVRRLLLISLVGRLPENAVLSFTGALSRLKISICCLSLWLRSAHGVRLVEKGMDSKICRTSGSDRVLKQPGPPQSEHLITACIAVVLAILMFHREAAGPIKYKRQWIKEDQALKILNLCPAALPESHLNHFPFVADGDVLKY